MILSFIGICCCVIAFGITIIICELMWEVHKEIRKGNVELLLQKDKRNAVYFNEGSVKVMHKDYYIYQIDYLLENLDREYQILKRLIEYKQEQGIKELEEINEHFRKGNDENRNIL